MTYIRPYHPDDEGELRQAARDDNHEVAAPTHVVINSGKIVGYFSIGGIPMTLSWLDSKANNAITSTKALRELEGHLRMSGVKCYCMPCATDSPFYQNMEKLGFIEVPMMRFFFKRLQ